VTEILVSLLKMWTVNLSLAEPVIFLGIVRFQKYFIHPSGIGCYTGRTIIFFSEIFATTAVP
jgi:hypothetical protein